MGVISPSVIIHLYLSLPHFSSLSFSLSLSLFFPVRISKKNTWTPGLAFVFVPFSLVIKTKNEIGSTVNRRTVDEREKEEKGRGEGW